MSIVVLENPFDELATVMRRWMLSALPVDHTFSLSGLDLRTLHIVYATWRGRMPAAMPRTVHVSPELLANPALDLDRNRDGLAATVREIAFGESLRPRLSTAIEHAYSPTLPGCLEASRGQSGYQRQIDRLLADWGIHHLHLGLNRHPRQPQFVQRTKHALFAAFVRTDAYLIDLRAHESHGDNWSELAILETVVRNWPNAGIVYGSDYATGIVGSNHSDEDRRDLRAAGVSAPVEIDGRVWSAGGQTVAGTPLRVSRHSMAVSWFLSGYEPTQGELRDELSTKASEHGVRDRWHAHVDGDEYGFVSDGVFIVYGSLLP